MLRMFLSRNSGHGRSYLWNIFLTLINQLLLLSALTVNCRIAIWNSAVLGSLAILRKVVIILVSIWASIVLAPSRVRTATEAVLSGNVWICFRNFLWYLSSVSISDFLILRSSMPCSSRGITNVDHIWNDIIGDIPFFPCKPLPKRAYTVFLAVWILLSTSGVLLGFLSIPRFSSNSVRVQNMDVVH